MSALLDQAACEDAKRREDLARSDAAMASNLPEVFRIALAPFAPPKFSEAELLEGDVFNNDRKPEKAHARNDAGAAAAQMQWLDAMRRAGW